jgi:hypothetical protein
MTALSAILGTLAALILAPVTAPLAQVHMVLHARACQKLNTEGGSALACL